MMDRGGGWVVGKGHGIQTQEHSGAIIASDHGQSLPVATVLRWLGLSNDHHAVVVPCGADQGNPALDPRMDERLTRALLPTHPLRVPTPRYPGGRPCQAGEKDLWSWTDYCTVEGSEEHKRACACACTSRRSFISSLPSRTQNPLLFFSFLFGLVWFGLVWFGLRHSALLSRRKRVHF
jgi:hypothetical protein